GDRAQTVNISTMSAMVVAGAGVRVVKHGNRAASSKSGTADCLEALGIDLSLPPEAVQAVASRAGITFCFAQTFHPSMRHAAIPRRELGVPTVFNVLGPLTNPAEPTYSAIGVADLGMAPLVAQVLAERGGRAAVFRGDDGLDELTVSTTSTVWWVEGGRVATYVVTPLEHGVQVAGLESLRGGDATHNAQVVHDIFGGAAGPIRDAVLLNSGIALAVAGGVPVVDQASFDVALAAGMSLAARAIDSGLALDTLDRWRATTVAAAAR
ncbi:MAG: anthranilate phosphoribosyltransferase, partial [Micrococcales bacterium]|nr:anthranilate phosphoribosyltransferase [Micrococcales bacterium]